MDSSTSPFRQQPSLRQRKLLGVALIVAGFSAHAMAVPFIDASDDLLATYAGPRDADLDVVQADVVIDPDAQINSPTGPIHTFHLCVWFNARADAIKAGRAM